KAEEDKNRAQTLIANHETEIATMMDELVSLRSQSANSGAMASLGKIEQLEEHISTSRFKTYGFLAKNISIYLDASHMRIIQNHLPASCQPGLKAALDLRNLVSGKQPQDWLADAGAVQQLVTVTKSLCGAADSIKNQREALGQDVAKLTDRERMLNQQLQFAA